MQAFKASIKSTVRAAMVVPLLGVAACGGYTPDYRLLARGPNPEFNGQALAVAADNQRQVVQQLSIMAGLDPVLGPQGPAQWKQFGIAALGRARLECNAYITEIMKVEEDRRTINQQVGLAGAATAGILGLSGAAGVAIAITAIAFGLLQGTVDNITTGLLYSLGAEPVQAMIANLRSAYTARLTDASWQDRPTTFNTIYGYLELCTPVVLREKIKTAVATAPAQATAGDDQGGPPRVTFQASPIITVLPAPRAPLPVVTPPPRIPGTVPTEIGIRPAEITDIQLTLCVPPGELAVPETAAQTRAAIRQFMSARFGGDPATKNDQMTSGDTASRLRQAVANAKSGDAVSTCAARGYQSAFEVGLFGHLPAEDVPDKIRFVQNKINAKLDAASRIEVDGKMDTLHIGVGRLRKQFDPSDGATAIDFAFYKKIS